MTLRLFIAALYILGLCINVKADSDEHPTISYQGILENETGGPVEDRAYVFTFRIYENENDDTPLWIENQVLQLRDGIFNAELGSVEIFTIPFDRRYWLAISVDGGEELSPRIPLTATPYAFHALSIQDNSITSGKIVDGSVTTAKLADKAVTQEKLHPAVSLPIGGEAGGDLTGTFPHPLIADSAVTTPKIAPDAVTAEHLRFPLFRWTESSSSVLFIGNSGDGTAIRANAAGAEGRGIEGWATGSGGVTYGVRGLSFSSTTGRGVYGESLAISGPTVGIEGRVRSPDGFAGYFSGPEGSRNYFQQSVGIGIEDPSVPLQVAGNVIAGASNNESTGENSMAFGGSPTGPNIASGNHSFVAGGVSNVASGVRSFAAGRRAHALHHGSLVWGDNSFADVESTDINQFVARAAGGFFLYTNASLTSGVTLAGGGSSWSTVSDRNVKENFRGVDSREILDRLITIPIKTWNYIAQDPSVRHIGPMAQDFYAAFGLGDDELRINTINADGIALAAIQGLNKKLETKIRQLESALDTKAQRLRELENRLSALEAILEEE
jgi:hypothetical protein